MTGKNMDEAVSFEHYRVMSKLVGVKLDDDDYAYAVRSAERVGVPVATYCKMILREQRLAGAEGPRAAARAAMPTRSPIAPQPAGPVAALLADAEEAVDALDEEEPFIGGSSEEDEILERRLAEAPPRPPIGQAPSDQEFGGVMSLGRSAPLGAQHNGLPRPGRHALGGRA